MNIPKKFLVILVAAQGFGNQDIVASSTTTALQQSYGQLFMESLTTRNVMTVAGVAAVFGIGTWWWRRSKLSKSRSSTPLAPDSKEASLPTTPPASTTHTYSTGGHAPVATSAMYLSSVASGSGGGGGTIVPGLVVDPNLLPPSTEDGSLVSVPTTSSVTSVHAAAAGVAVDPYVDRSTPEPPCVWQNC